MKIFAERLIELRAEKKISQAQLAKIIGISNGTIGFWETNKAEPTAPNLILLADFFDVSIDFLLGREEEYEQNNYTQNNKALLIRDAYEQGRADREAYTKKKGHDKNA